MLTRIVRYVKNGKDNALDVVARSIVGSFSVTPHPDEKSGGRQMARLVDRRSRAFRQAEASLPPSPIKEQNGRHTPLCMVCAARTIELLNSVGFLSGTRGVYGIILLSVKQIVFSVTSLPD